jgi:hypothetical protein
MKRFLMLVSLVLTGCSAGATDPLVVAELDHEALSRVVERPHEALCPGLEGGYRWHCKGRRIVGGPPVAGPEAGGGLGADDLASAYALDIARQPNATVAIIDAYNYPNAESDLKQYRAQYGLPPCTQANGCLKIVNQNGQTSPLPPNAPAGDDWSGETALDLDMASAGCPNCKILLVLADDDQGDGLMIAQDTAAKLGATTISNSWGGPETASDLSTQYEHYFQVSTKAGIFVAAGDDGYNDGGQGPDYPSTSAFVIGVGGTTLTQSSGTRGWAEAAWSSGGSGCSLSVPKPGFQTTSTCKFRASSDVAAVGNPSTGVLVYQGGWQAIGGTSAASPLAAGIFALTGHGMDGPGFPYANAGAFYDVASGTNGNCGSILCKAGAGWDGPTGVGTPNGKMMAGIPSGSSPPDMAAPPDMAGPAGGQDAGDGTGGVGGGPTGGNGNGSGSGSGGGNGNGGNGSGNNTSGCSFGGATGATGFLVPLLLIGLALVRRRQASQGRT